MPEIRSLRMFEGMVSRGSSEGSYEEVLRTLERGGGVSGLVKDDSWVARGFNEGQYPYKRSKIQGKQ